MKKATCTLLLFAALTGCLTGTQGNLAGRWDIKAVDMPDVAGFIDSIKSGDEDTKESMESFFRGNALVLRNNNTYDLVLCKKYLHGNWKFEDNNSTLLLTDEAAFVQPVALKVNKVDRPHMALTADNENMAKLVPPFQLNTTGYTYLTTKRRVTFFLASGDGGYWQEENDPYSKANNLWRIQPHNPETDAQIALRINRHLQFCRLVVKDAIEKQGMLSFNWFATPLVLSTRGCYLRDFSHAKGEWASNFYDTAQALKGYQLIAESIHKCHYQPDESRSRFDNYVFMLDEVIEHLNKQ